MPVASEVYTLPPIDRSEYDRRPNSEPVKTLSSSPSSECRCSKKSSKYSDSTVGGRSRIWTEEFLSTSPPRKCWCRDCPWLIVYGLLLALWVALVIICFWQSAFKNLFKPRKEIIPMNNTGCQSVCSQLAPPATVPPDEFDLFHCTQGHDKWVNAKNVSAVPNPNCLKDCQSYTFTDSFLEFCVQPPRSGYPVISVSEANRRTFNGDFGDVGLHWHWIAHIVVITNTISLFFLLLSLFFCCLQVLTFAGTSIVTNLSLTVLLVFYVYFNYQENKRKGLPGITQFIVMEFVFALLSAIFTIYCMAWSIIVAVKRFHVSCAVAQFTTKFVSSVPTILLEAILTHFLLAVWMVILIIAALALEGGGVRGTLPNEKVYYLPVWFIWIVRVFTGIMGFWTAHFIINCQTIIIHGTMARFYFDKNATNKVIRSHKRLLKYHLCTACFAGLLFNWLYWIRWWYPKSIIRSRSLFGTATLGLPFIRAGREVLDLLHPPGGSRLRAISKVNPFYFLVHAQIFAIMAIVIHLVFYVWRTTLWFELILTGYAYFVGLATINIYRVTKDSIFLCYELDRSLTRQNPARTMKLPYAESYLFSEGTNKITPK